MHSASEIVMRLRERGELWEVAPGLVGLRGDVLCLRNALERVLGDVAALHDGGRCEDWAPPPALSLATLARADYFAAFPQWLTLASHLREDAASLECVARSDDPAAAARFATAPAKVALPPAVCYHVYAALAGQTLAAPVMVTVQGTCWRHEGAALRPLLRDWAFTMREGVCIGDAQATSTFRTRGVERAMALASSLGLAARVEEATDPFFAPTSRGRSLLQRVKGLKQELMLVVGDDRVAAASFNHHEQFFGDAFDIHLRDGAPAASACVAFGLDRWLLAFLAAHGTDARYWPEVGVEIAREVSA